MTQDAQRDTHYFRDLTGDVVAAYVGNNAVSTTDLPHLIRQVYESLIALAARPEVSSAPAPAVPVGKSKTANYLVCLEDGKKFRTLARHLHAQHQMTPEQYRRKWSLPADYPMAAPTYSAARSAISKGLHERPAEPVKSAAAEAPRGPTRRARVRKHQ